MFRRQAYQERAQLAVAPHRATQTPPDGMRWCSQCTQFLPVKEFRKTGHCLPCQSRVNHAASLKKYGITPARYEELLRIQGGACAICQRAPQAQRLAVDHNHKTGEVRGLLCVRCNRRVLGGSGESVMILRRAACYLEEPPARVNRPVTCGG